MVKERPILFKGLMVRPILNMKLGVWPPEAIDPSKPIKYHTRRVIKSLAGSESWDKQFEFEGRDGPSLKAFRDACPYGKPGDRLWVREPWQPCGPWDGLDGMHIRLKADGTLFKPLNPPKPFLIENDGRDGLTKKREQKWRPSIYMPRWASRINLEITAIRAEKVQEISEADAQAEGIQLKATCQGSGLVSIGEKYSPFDYVKPRQENESLQDVAMRAWKFIPHFAALWDSINAKPKPRYVRIDGKRVIAHYESYPWAEGSETREHRGKPWHVHGNPMIWDVEFKRVEG